MLWHESLKSIHYSTLLIFQNKKKPTNLRVKTWGDKRHVIPPMSKHGGGDISPPSPRIYALEIHTYVIIIATSARPEGQRMAEPIPPSAQSSSYSLTTLSSYVSTDRRAVTDMNGETRTLRCAPFLCRLRRRECCMLGAPSSQPTVTLHELPPARLVIHRQTSAHERRKWTRSVQSRSGILAYLCPWSSSTFPARATGRLLLEREVATLLYAEFRARNH